MREAASGNDGGKSEERVVAQMHEETGDHGAGARAGEGKDEADGAENRDKGPGPSQLLAVHYAEEKTGDQDAGDHAERFRDKWIEIASEDRFFDKRSDENSHCHEQNRAHAIAEHLLDGHVFWRADPRADDGDANGQAGTGKKVEPGIGGGCFRGEKLAPAER